jgi:hypothetical protein
MQTEVLTKAEVLKLTDDELKAYPSKKSLEFAIRMWIQGLDPTISVTPEEKVVLQHQYKILHCKVHL